MSVTTRGPWHTLTVEHDGVDEEGAPLLVYTLDHPDACPPAALPDPSDLDGWYPGPRCHLDHIIQEWGGEPDVHGIPTEPGEYRLHAWREPGHWFGPYYCDPEEGIEIDEEHEPVTAPILDNDPPF